ncbi:MAG: NAD-dependent epimerase/dehydratase family protein [Nanoarchaeota archaeon]
MSYYKGKNVLVAGGTGLIGNPLVDMLVEQGANVRVASLDDRSRARPGIEFYQTDLTDYTNCREVCKGMEHVFNLLCIKGTVKTAKETPARFMVPMIAFDANLIRAARDSGVEKYLYSSSVGIYPPAEVFYEDEGLKNPPSENYKFPAWAKRVGEFECQAYHEEGWNKIAIVRPASTYGPHDNFAEGNAMVIASLTRDVMEGKNPLVIWGDGSDIRDFVHSRDVARGMMLALEKSPGAYLPMNLAGGREYTIKELAETIQKNAPSKIEIVWDTTKPSGDKRRVMDISRAGEILGWKPEVSLEEGIKEVMTWYISNIKSIKKSYKFLE